MLTCTHLCTEQLMETIWPCSSCSWVVELTPWLPLVTSGQLSTQLQGGTLPPVWRHCSTTHLSTPPLRVGTLLSTCPVSRTTGTQWSCSWPGIKVDMANMQGDTPRMVAERVGNLGQLFDAVMPRGVISHKE